MARSVDLRVDACLYGVSALLVAGIAHSTELHTFRVWAAFAGPGYLVAAAVTIIAIAASRSWHGHVVMWLRLGIAAFSFVVAALMPLAYEVHARADGRVRLEQAEVAVIEQASTRLVSGKDPYATTFDERGLESRPQAQRYFAYMPLMLIFGLPRAIFGPGQFTDARVIMALVTLAALATALRLSSMAPAQRLRLAQVAIILPSGAIFIATGGDDLSVLALVMLGIVILRRNGRLGWPILVFAALLKQTAWPVVLVFLISFRLDRRESVQGMAAKRLGTLLAAALSLSAPFLVWRPGPFVSGVVLFPVGLTSARSFDQPPTIGSWALSAAGIAGNPALRDALVAGVLGGVLLLGVSAVIYVNRMPALGTTEPVCIAGLLMLALIITSPISRPGLLVYPVDLLTFGLLVGDTGPSFRPSMVNPGVRRMVVRARKRLASPAQNRIGARSIFDMRRSDAPKENGIERQEDIDRYGAGRW